MGWFGSDGGAHPLKSMFFKREDVLEYVRPGCTFRLLESENIHTVRDLVRRNEDQLLEVRNFGETTLNEVQEKLAELGLRLGMRVPATAGV